MNSIGILLAILAFVEVTKGMYNLIVIRYEHYQLPNAMYKNVFHVVTF